MATPAVLDFDSLLQPITATGASGDELRASVRTVRDAMRTSEKECLEYAQFGAPFEGAPTPQPPDWEQVIRSAVKILGSESKDLWIVAWLIEAVTRRYGFAGLRDGFQLARRLIESYWDTIEPRPDEDDGVDRTVRMLGNLNGSVLVDPIHAIPLSRPDGDLPALTSGMFRETSGEDRERLAAATPVEFFQHLVDDIAAARQEFAQLCQILEAQCGRDEAGYSLAPPSSEIRQALDDCQSRLLSLCGKRLPAAAVPASDADGEAAAAPTGAGDALPSVSQAVRSREEAFQVLQKVAEFFRRTEPHSPIADKLEQTIRWGRMPWRQLMTELVRDDSVRQEMFRQVGIRPDEQSTD